MEEYHYFLLFGKFFEVIDNKGYQFLNYCLHFCGDVKLEGLLHVTSFIECRLRMSNKIPTTKVSLRRYKVSLREGKKVLKFESSK